MKVFSLHIYAINDSIEPQIIKLLPLELDALKKDIKITENIEDKLMNILSI